MKGKKIVEIEGSSRRMYMRNTADITPKCKDICNTADIPTLSAIPP